MAEAFSLDCRQEDGPAPRYLISPNEKEQNSTTRFRCHRGGWISRSHLVDLLLARGHRVIGLDNLVTGSLANISHLAGNRSFRFIEQDVTEFLYLDESVEYVWHFASPASPVDYLELPIQTLKVGSLGTHKALGLAKLNGARFFSPRPPRFTATRSFILNRRIIGAMLIRSGPADATTKPSALPRP